MSKTRRQSGNDLELVRSYLAKAQSSKDRNIEFKLSFLSFKNICRAKKCYFTGLELNGETFSIDRIDSNKPYQSGNVVACHKAFNSLKGVMKIVTIS